MSLRLRGFGGKIEKDPLISTKSGFVKVIPQFCIAHPFCAYFNKKSLRNIIKMAAILLQKNKSKRARNGRFSGLKKVSKKKNGVKT